MGSSRPWLWGIVGALLAIVVTLGVTRLLGDDTAPSAGDPSPGDAPSSTETAPAGEGPSDPAQSGDPPGSDFTVAAYFVGQTGRGPRLFREFSHSTGKDVGVAAV